MLTNHHRKLRRLARANQLQYRKLEKIVKRWFKTREIKIQSEIWIYPEYPVGWDAVVIACERVWIIGCIEGTLFVKDIQLLQGFRPNGTIIFS